MKMLLKFLAKQLYGAYRWLVSVVPLGLKQAAKNRLVSLSLVLAKGSRSNSKANPLFYGLLQWFARYVGVDEMFLARAQTIANEQYAPESAVRLLVYYIRLALGLALPGFAYNIAHYLQTDEEKQATIALLEQALTGAKNTQSGNNIQIQLLRLQDTDLEDQNLKDYCHRLIDEAIAERHQTATDRLSTSLENKGLDVLVEVQDLLAKNGKQCFLTSGALLGLVRDGDFIRGDTDIDLGVFSDEVSLDEIRQMFADSGYYLDRDYQHKLSFFSPEGVLVEFYPCQRQDDKIILRSYGGAQEWHFSAFELTTRQFKGHKVLVPDNCDLYLDENFGNWRDQTLFYDWAFDSPVIEYGDNFEGLLFLATRFRNALHEGDRFTAQKTAQDMKEQFAIDLTEQFPHV